MSRIALCFIGLCLLGCSEVVRPKGTGATGLAKTVEVENSRMSQINKLNDAAQIQYNLAHRTFENVYVPVEGKPAPAELVEKLKKVWPTLALADVPKGHRFQHSLVLNTTEGKLKLAMFYDMDPDASRSVHALGLSGFFDGKEIKLQDNRLIIGDRVEQSVNFRSLGNRVPVFEYGALVIQAQREDVVSPNLSIILEREPQPKPKEQKDVIVGFIENELTEFEGLVAKIKAGKKVVIQSVLAEKRQEELFDTDHGTRLPNTDPKTGRIVPRQQIPEKR